jgi:hypothetical protein
MSDRTSHEIETLTIRIPIRLQRRGGRKLIMTQGRHRLRRSRAAMIR